MGRISDHNREVIIHAQARAGEMQAFPSPLEERMMKFLDDNMVFYEFQKIFYIRAKDGYIIRYYIADFYILDKAIIIEVDGKFHDKQKLHDKMRTRHIQEQYPEVSVLRFTWNDMSDEGKLNGLLCKVR